MDILKINKIHILQNKFGLTSFTLIRKITTVPLKWTVVYCIIKITKYENNIRYSNF